MRSAPTGDGGSHVRIPGGLHTLPDVQLGVILIQHQQAAIGMRGDQGLVGDADAFTRPFGQRLRWTHRQAVDRRDQINAWQAKRQSLVGFLVSRQCRRGFDGRRGCGSGGGSFHYCRLSRFRSFAFRSGAGLIRRQRRIRLRGRLNLVLRKDDRRIQQERGY